MLSRRESAVQEVAEELKPGPLTFRLRILLALLGVIIPMAAVLLIVLQRETSTQIEAAIHDAVGSSRNNLHELEQSWKTELASISRRYTRSTRILGAFDAAVEDGDPSVLAEAADYETKLAGFSGHLFVFFDPEGRVLCALLDGHVKTGRDDHSLTVRSIPRREESFGYSLWDGQLYAAHTTSLNLFSRKIGYLLVGFPIRENVVQRLGKRVEGEVCFVVGSSAVVSTPGIARSALLNSMEAAAGLNGSRVLTLSGRTWALFSEMLNPQEPGEGSMVCAIALDDALAPFRRIRAILIVTALASVVAAVIMGFFLSRELSTPILELVRGTAKVARGDYDFLIDIKSRDELGILGKAFNSMVRGLFLKEKYRDVLDKAVSPEIAAEMLKGDLFLGGENRTVTVLFADIRGFAAITEGMDPRVVITMLNDYLEGVGAAIESEGGVVDKYAGDEIMAIFGAPVSHSDDAPRAVRAALRMQEAIRSLSESRRAAGKPEIAVGIGINTGLAVAGNMGSRTRLNYTVLGESVNLAARLCSMAGAGQILVSAATLEAVGPHLEVQALEPVTLKGWSNPIGVWLVKGITDS
jgi:class 3 adenylate cyclase